MGRGAGITPRPWAAGATVPRCTLRGKRQLEQLPLLHWAQLFPCSQALPGNPGCLSWASRIFCASCPCLQGCVLSTSHGCCTCLLAWPSSRAGSESTAVPLPQPGCHSSHRDRESHTAAASPPVFVFFFLFLLLLLLLVGAAGDHWMEAGGSQGRACRRDSISGEPKREAGFHVPSLDTFRLPLQHDLAHLWSRLMMGLGLVPAPGGTEASHSGM